MKDGQRYWLLVGVLGRCVVPAHGRFESLVRRLPLISLLLCLLTSAILHLAVFKIDSFTVRTCVTVISPAALAALLVDFAVFEYFSLRYAHEFDELAPLSRRVSWREAEIFALLLIAAAIALAYFGG